MGARGSTLFAAAAVVLAMAAVPSRAEIFRWADEAGTIHYTDDASRIPPEYKGKSSIAIHEPPKDQGTAPATPALPGAGSAPYASPAYEPPPAVSGERENTDSEIERLRSKIAAKEEFLKYVEDRQNLARYPDRRLILNPGDMDLYNKYKEELPNDREQLRALEPPKE